MFLHLVFFIEMLRNSLFEDRSTLKQTFHFPPPWKVAPRRSSNGAREDRDKEDREPNKQAGDLFEEEKGAAQESP